MYKAKVKVCGITSLDDAMMGIEAGAAALGFVFAESPRQITPQKAWEITKELKRDIEKIGVFVDNTPGEIEYVAGLCNLDTIQIYHWPASTIDCFTGIKTIQAFQVGNEDDISLACNSAADIVLLDAYHKDLYGGTGQVFDWELLEQYKPTREFILSGGLNSGNIYEAILRFKPYGVDVSSGVEVSPGKKDSNKINSFMDRVNEAEEYLEQHAYE